MENKRIMEDQSSVDKINTLNFVNEPTEKNEKTFKNTQDFRLNATEEDYQELEKYINSLVRKSEDFKCEKYPFSYSSASNLLKEKNSPNFGLNIKEGQKDFIILSMPKGEYASRTFTLKKSTMDRLDRFCEQYEQYNKQAIITVLIEEVLNNYESKKES